MAESDCSYRLTYFDLRGRGELIRFIFHYAQVSFEDVRIPVTEWLEWKPKVPREKVPVLELTSKATGETMVLTESLAIARFLAKRFGLVGETDAEAAECDEVVDCLIEGWYTTGYAYYEKEEQRKQELIKKLEEVEMPRLFGYAERKLVANGGEHIVGKKVTWADLAVSVMLYHMVFYAKSSADCIPTKFPALHKLAKEIEKIPQVAAWITKRPATDR